MSREQGFSPSDGDDGTERDGRDGGDDRGLTGQGRYQLDSDGQFVAVTDGFADIVDRERESLLGTHVTTVVDEEDADRYEVALGKLRDSGELPETELAVCLATSDGESVPCTIRLTALAGAEQGWKSLGVVSVTPSSTEQDVQVQRLYETITENAPETAFIVDSDRTVTYVSEGIEEFFEDGTTEFTSKPLDAVTGETIATEQDRERYLALVDELLAGERTDGQIEVALEAPTGERLVSDIKLSTIESGGDVEMLVGISRDITERVEQKTELQRERDLNDRLLDTAPIGITVHGADGTITRTNERAETILGLTKAQLTETHCEELACTFRDEAGEELPTEQLPSQRVIETGNPEFGRELQVVHPDGEKRWMRANAAPVFGPDGELDRVIGAFSDITEHREREQMLESERAFTEAVLNAVPDLVYAYDDHGRFLRWNDRIAEVSGYDESELEGKYVLDFIPEQDHEMITTALEAVYQGSVERRETALQTKDGAEIPYEFSAAPISSEDGELLGFAGVGRNIADQQARERRLREQNERLERLNRINAVIRDIDQAMVRASTREEVETAACERLAAADTYQFAWIGEQRQTDTTLVPRATAGPFTEYLDEITIRTDDTPTGQGPAGRAYRTREIQVCQNIHEDPRFAPSDSDMDSFVDTIDSFGFQSIASIPLTYEETLYGVLNVYASEPYSFGAMEQAVLAELGETIGHAISGLQAKQALLTEQVTELTIEIEGDESFPVVLSERADCTVVFEGSVPQSDGSPVYYVTVRGTDADRITEIADESVDVDELRIVSEHDDACVVEYTLLSQPAIRALSAQGGRLKTAAVTDGTVTATVELPSSTDPGLLLDALQNKFDAARLRSQRDTERSVQTSHQFREQVIEELTDRQQAALEIAYYADYFDWPRESTGEELAAAMGVSAPTFHKHLRLAEQKLTSAVLDDQ